MPKSSLLAVALLAFVASPTLAQIDPGDRRIYLHSGTGLSFLEDFLGDRGIHLDLPEINVSLPPQAEAAVEKALGRAESALNRVFGDSGLLEDLDASLPDVSQTVDDALNRAQEVLDRIELSDVNVPDVSSLVDNALSRAEEALTRVESVVPPNVEPIVNEALGEAQSTVDDALDRVFGDGGVLDEIEDLVPQAAEALDSVFGEGGTVDRALSEIPTDRLPTAAIEAIDNAAGIIKQVLGDRYSSEAEGEITSLLEGLTTEDSSSIGFQFAETALASRSFFMVPSTAAVPEPTACVLALAGFAAVSSRRRR